MQTADDFFSNRGFFFGKIIKFNKVNMNGLQQADTNIYCEAFEAFLESCRERVFRVHEQNTWPSRSAVIG